MKIGNVIMQWIVDSIIAIIVIWTLHWFFSYPWILIGLISMFMLVLRVEDAWGRRQ